MLYFTTVPGVLLNYVFLSSECKLENVSCGINCCLRKVYLTVLPWGTYSCLISCSGKLLKLNLGLKVVSW